MKTELKGLREPSSVSSNALRIGTLIRVKINGKKDAKMMLSALVRKGPAVFALMTPHTRLGKVDSGLCELVRGPGRSNIRVGRFVPVADVLGDKSPDLGFQAVQLEASPLFNDPVESSEKMVTVRDFRSNLWDRPNFRVRRVNAEEVFPASSGSCRNQQSRAKNNKLGRLTGETFKVRIKDGTEEDLCLPYCGLAASRGRPFANKQSVGAPVISKSGALSGFIVGRNSRENLILPVEELTKEQSLSFVTFGEDWPMVRIAAEKNRTK
ncbi:hypothetical protein QCM77_09525 [Bradyrhizobium sp. SSUT18]|uniref:hypothetical protein n=1 Tax=Bradyrhizobium sp. SSUT18 TaxID=3040602 RepID=UPI0024483DAF|nr:hypothetical protein [Bradyrhizobium sp. SSUT18]MDH2400176.1 hypothetical protein [Bradyrhizobium sp. SSUT18]